MNMGTSLDHDIFRLSPIAILCEDWSGVWRAFRQELSRCHAEADAFLQANPGFILDVRRHHVVLDANPAALELLGVPDLSRLQASVARLLPADPVSNGQVLRAMARGDTSCRGERCVRHEDGRVVPLMWRATLPTEEAGFDRVYFFALDITEEKRAEEALLTARASLGHAARLSLVGELTASVAHDMAQPIGAIASNAGAIARWLSKDPPNIAEALTSVRSVSNSARHASEVLKRVKNFVRRGTPTQVSLSPLEAVRQAVALIEHEARRHDARLVVDVQGGLPEVVADPTQLQQVLVNIIVNAIQAMASTASRNRCVTVSAHDHAPGRLTFLVRDTGPGITQDVATQVFEPFYTSKVDGVGLGLAICRRIVEEHGGQLWMNSVDIGAEFAFSLPLTAEARHLR